MRYSKISSFKVMDLLREAQKFDDTIHFEIGQPDLEPSFGVKKALKDAIDGSKFGYTQTMGLLQLRQKIAAHYKREYEIEVDPDTVLITPGTSNAFLIAYLLTLNSGDTLAIADPSYPCYKNFAVMVDAKVETINIYPENGYIIKPKDLEGKKVNALHISSPSNPLGNIYTQRDLKELAEYCKSEGIWLISDELYHGLVYEQKAHSALEFSKKSIVINGFSKYFCMPGLRIGWMILPKDLIKPAEAIAQNLYLSAPTLSQYAALEAFDYDYLNFVKNEYKKRRDYLYGELKNIFKIDVKPQGAFYLWCDISKYSNSCIDFSYELLHKLHIAATPGADFGKNGTETKLRFAYTREIEHMQKGIKRLKEYLL